MNSNRKRGSTEDDCSTSRKYKMEENIEEQKINIDNSATVINKIANLYAERLMSDICLVVGRVEYPSHRLILCASSDVFQVMLMNQNWTGSQEKRVVLGETPACAAVFEHFLRYLYTGKIQLDYTTVIPLVSLADKYNVKDLLKLGLDYMLRNVSTASKKNQLVSWFQFALAAGHSQLAEMCRDFIKWNFESVSYTIDFGSLDPEILANLLACNDLVIEDEFKVFDCVHRWLEAKAKQMVERGEEHIEIHFNRLVQILVPLIRFPMMSQSKLANLLAFNQITKSYTDILVERIRFSLSYHNGQMSVEQVSKEDRAVFTPRLYTTERFCASITIDHLHNLPSYHSRTLHFSSQKFTADHKADEQTEWFVDVFPKGVWFQRCLTVYKPPGLEVPERILKTVRVAVNTKEKWTQRVQIGILLVGDQDDFEHVRLVKTRNYIFSSEDQIINFDDLVDYDELNDTKHRSHFLTGPNKDSFKVFIVITPLSDLSLL